jgi:uncharacterized membrane-anchored protein
MTSRLPEPSRLPNRQPQPIAQPAPVPEVDRRIPGWRLWVPLLFQAALILAVPAQDAYTYTTGRTVVLQTVPVDPYDLLRGYSQTLSYDISRPDSLKALPGGKRFNEPVKGDVYIVLRAPQNSATPPRAWQPVRVSVDRPTDLAANQVAIKGRFDGWQLLYGLETYYMPEDQRQQINTAIGQAQGQQAFVVEVKVDAQGNAVPASLWVKERNYRF